MFNTYFKENTSSSLILTEKKPVLEFKYPFAVDNLSYIMLSQLEC